MKIMKRTNFVTKLISVILFLFLAAYFGIYLVQSITDPLVTAPAISMQTQVSFSAPGLIVREEQVVSVPHPIVASLVQEGERVSVGMAYLAAFSSTEDLERDMRRNQIQREIHELEARMAAGDGPEQIVLVEGEIRRQIGEMRYAINRGNLRDLEARTIALLTLSSDRGGLEERLDYLRAEQTALGTAPSATRHIYAHRPGIYSARVDGFEHISPADFDRMDVPALTELLYWRPADVDTGGGKLITASTWYYMALVPEEEAEHLYARLYGSLPNRVMVTFSGLDAANVDMQVHALGQQEEGSSYRLAIFSSITGLVDTLGLRQTEALVTYNTFTGIRVPREALHFGELDPETGEPLTYVFTLTANIAERKFVEVIYTGVDYYLVLPDNERTPAHAALREGNTLIVRGRDIHHGRVVR